MLSNLTARRIQQFAVDGVDDPWKRLVIQPIERDGMEFDSSNTIKLLWKPTDLDVDRIRYGHIVPVQ